ncbi:MAG TPA: DNA gyrase inhibitor YacG [Polyangiaceae bacterium]|nr:DNA gyrase inhibitor YacG [Polyangiaceae bacterium]
MLCPVCRRPVVMDRTVNPTRPFCSARCKTIDFGQWVDGSYAIAGDPIDPETGQPIPRDGGQKPGPSGGDA